MADTGAPWNLPYPLPTDLVRDGADAIKDLAEAAASGLSAAGGLVAVKHVLKTNPFSASVTAGGNVAVDDLTITHEVADPANRLIITAYFGAAANSEQAANTGIAVAEDGTLLAIGDADGSRVRTGAGGFSTTTGSNPTLVVAMPSVTFVHTPGAGEKIYTVRAVNITSGTRTVFINRTEADSNSANNTRAASALVIQEVKV